MKHYRFILIFSLFIVKHVVAQQVAVLKYQGGGDWYSNPTSVTNLINYCNENINTNISIPYQSVTPDSVELFDYPIIFMTGHGNVVFSDSDLDNLRDYLLSGGFLHIDDNYGMKPYILRELKKLFPDKTISELPATHPIFAKPYTFVNGLPKIHEHDGKRPQALGYFEDKRLLLVFTYEADLNDGWENQEVHNDPNSIRLQALKMGANLIQYVFQH